MRKLSTLLVLTATLLATTTFAQRPASPVVPPLAKVDFPRYETKRLPNGLTVYAIQHREQPILSIRLLMNAGAENDPADLAGLASFTASLLNQGTKTRTAAQIAETIDQIGGTLSASADMETTVIGSSVLTEHANTAFELLNDILMNPEFAQQELDRLKQQAMSNISANMEDPDFLADAVFSRALYGSHPYGHQEGGTPESIPAIERQDIVRFHETFYAPNIAAVAIVGDISTAEAFRLAERYFGAWKRKDIPAAQQPAPPKPTGRRIVLIDKPDAVQTEIRVGKLTVARKDPDYFNILIGSYVLGGSGVSRLNQKLRIERGLTYGAYATITPRRGPGNFYSVTDTRTEKTTEALSLILEEMESLRLKEVPAQELKDAQTYVIGSFPLSIELPANLATRLTTIFTYDLGDNYLATYRDRLAAVTSADVLRVAKEKLSPEDVTIVLVGKADDFKDALRPFGEVKVIPAGEVNLGSSF